jgi:energy-converting hydrogenase A subunit M
MEHFDFSSESIIKANLEAAETFTQIQSRLHELHLIWTIDMVEFGTPQFTAEIMADSCFDKNQREVLAARSKFKEALQKLEQLPTDEQNKYPNLVNLSNQR